MLNCLSDELHKRLSPSWFSLVDDVLLQNALVRALSNGAIRPAEHFFTTSIEAFRSFYNEWNSFITHVKSKLGTSWDERLWEPTKSFFRLASTIVGQMDSSRPALPSTTTTRTSEKKSTTTLPTERRKKDEKLRTEPIMKMSDEMSGMSISPDTRTIDTMSSAP